MNTVVKRGLIAAIAVAALALVGCSPQASENASTETMADMVTVTDVWVKEPTESMSTMTALFGNIENTGSSEVVLTGGSSDIAEMVQIHEVTAEGQMQEVKGGLIIKAGATSPLRPGENHVMLMDLKKTLAVGDEVTVTLTFKDGSTLNVTGLVKSAAGGDESYDEGSEHGEMNMG